MEKQITYELQEIAQKIEQLENAMRKNDNKIKQLECESKENDNKIASFPAKKNYEEISRLQAKKKSMSIEVINYAQVANFYVNLGNDKRALNYTKIVNELVASQQEIENEICRLEKNIEEKEKLKQIKKENEKKVCAIQEENKKLVDELMFEKQRLLKQELLIDQLSPKIREILGMAYEDSNYDLYELRREDPDNKLHELINFGKLNGEEFNHKLYDLIDYEFNFLFLSLLKKAPIMCEEEILSIVTDYINSRIIYEEKEQRYYIKLEQKKRVRELLNLDARLLNNKEFLSIINSTAFCFTREIFLTPELVNRSEFMDYFIQMVGQRQCDDTQYFASGITYGLNCHLDYDLVIYLGRFRDNYDVRKIQKKYMRHRKLFYQISKIKNDPKKQDLLEWLFGLDDVHLTQLEEFCRIPEVSKQLLDNESLYYQVLMSSVRRDWNRYGFCEPEDLFEVNYEVWDHGNLDGMMHYFDSFIKGHYIYFFQDGAMHQVPILSYYRNCKQKVEKFMDYIDITCGSDHDIIPTEMAEIEEKYADVLSGFDDICVQSLIESMDETLEREEMDEWDHLLELSPTVVEDDEFSKMKIYY